MKIFYTGMGVGLAFLLFAAEAHLDLPGRKAFVRNEKNAFLKVSVQAGEGVLSDLELSGMIAGFPVRMQKADKLAAGQKHEFRIPVETRLSTGKYPAVFTLKAAELKKTVKHSSQILIGPELHDRMPVLCWGYYPFHHHSIQELGFTHASQNWWRSRAYCDEMLFDGFRAMDSYQYFSQPAMKNLPYLRLNRSGRPYPALVNTAHPKVQEAAAKAAMERGVKYAGFPAVEGALLNSEIRDATKVSFDPVSKAAFLKFAGFPIPPEAEEKDGIHYSTIRDFPLSRIVPDDDRVLTFYKWFWKDGDGYNVLNSRMDQAYRAGFKRPIWTFYDPAVRVPPIWGSGGNVDVISHWVYACPDPISIGATTSELQAMAEGNPKQKIMNMTQIIVYRSTAAPIGMKPAGEPAWAKEFPKAPYVTLAPDMMGIAIWTQISRQVCGIMFHGLDSLLKNPRPGKRKDIGYQCTNHETATVLKELMHKVVKPLGPVLKRIPERNRDVAVLESFASFVFAQRGTWGWKGWPSELHLAMLWGNLAPKVVYDETILRDKLKGVKVLILPCCDVLTEKVFNIIADFQRQGGIVVGDQYLVPGITPDITIEEYKHTGDVPKDKAALQKIGVALRDRLAPHYQPYVRTSNPDIVTWVRSSGNADYLFSVNDNRTFGDYFGPYKKAMEKSVDNAGTITIRRANTAVAYDLVNHCEVPFTIENGNTVIHVVHDSKNIGKLFLLLPEKPGRLELELASSAKKGETLQFRIALTTVSGKKLESLHPVGIEVRDSEGRLTCDSTSAALENGIYSQSLTIPLNAVPGQWKISVVDHASGMKTQKILFVR